ncbi:hypothetical protein GH714_004548 [Hevea brasiliensis]|uniref:Uncharacterized protein n=1 Tax=Hevea brasiliensis TaxID=3981 RepID=A0A6A6LH33_HEVBR|nr:hypothetical protein GH714_004548 [Hevea brasiliensis]
MYSKLFVASNTIARGGTGGSSPLDGALLQGTSSFRMQFELPPLDMPKNPFNCEALAFILIVSFDWRRHMMSFNQSQLG